MQFEKKLIKIFGKAFPYENFKMKLSVVLISLVALAYSQHPPVDSKCLTEHCSRQMTNCSNEGRCTEALDCVGDCWRKWDEDPSPQKYTVQNCSNKCLYSYGSLNFLKLANCIDVFECLSMPAMSSTCKGPNDIKVARNISYLEIVGDWWILRGYSPVYDCYPCQRTTITDTYYVATFQAFLVDNSVKLAQERGVISGNDPLPCFNVTIGGDTLGMGVKLLNTFWVFDCIEDDIGNKYYLIYYCGNGNSWSYEGAFVYSKAASISIKAKDEIEKSFRSNIGLDFEHFCSPTTTNCPY